MGLPGTEEEAVKFLQEKGVFVKQRKCSSDHDMRLFFMETRGFFWKCSKETCNNKRISVRDGTWFSHCNVSLVRALRFLYGWSRELTSTIWCRKQLGMPCATTLEWHRFIRDAIIEDLDRRPCRQIGGEGRIVEVDETIFVKPKSTVDMPPQWIVGGTCRETGQCFLKVVPNRNASTLLNVIKDNVADGSTIYSDCLKVYKAPELEVAGLQQLKASRRLDFIDPTSAEAADERFKTTDVIWGSLKWRSKHHRGSAQNCLNSNLAEFIWRQEIGDTDPLEALLDAIKRYRLNDHCECECCGLTLSNQEDLNAHKYEIHECSAEVVQHHLKAKENESPTEAAQHNGNAVEYLPESCPACDVRLRNVTDLIAHANNVHEFNGTVQHMLFPTMNAFKRWKKEMEAEHNCYWIQVDERTEQLPYHGLLRCQGPRRTGIRKRKRKPSPRRICTSFMNVKKSRSCITSVEYCLEHFGHEQQPQNSRLPWSVKVEIAEMLKQGMPVVEIVRILEQENEGALMQQHSVTVLDVMRLVAELKANPEMFETRVSTSPEISMKTESDLAESSMHGEFFKREPTSAAESSISPIRSSSQEVVFKTELGPVERPMWGTFTKKEPMSAATLKTEEIVSESSMRVEAALFADPPTRKEPISVEAKPPRDDGVRMFTLTTAPDGKGFALVGQ